LRGQRPSRDARARHPYLANSGDSPRGAAEAATSYLGVLATAAAGHDPDARASVIAMTTGPLQVELKLGLPMLTSALRARLASSAAPATFDGWPLGYKVTRFGATTATVSVWHLDIAASSALGVMTTDYATTTYEVEWRAGVWRIERAGNVRGPSPPPTNAPPTEVDQFAKAIQGFSGYSYAP
jgi:hypothetical protein